MVRNRKGAVYTRFGRVIPDQFVFICKMKKEERKKRKKEKGYINYLQYYY